MYKLYTGDAFTIMMNQMLEPEQFQACVTSPPYYGLKAYLDDLHLLKEFEMGTEPTVDRYISGLVGVFSQVKRLLKPDGLLFVNLGDSLASFRDGKVTPESFSNNNLRSAPISKARNRSKSTFEGTDVKHKDLIGIPWEFAFAMRKDGWYLRSEIIWNKPVRYRPESVQDRPTRTHETIFMFSKSERYYFNKEHLPIDFLSIMPKKYKHKGKHYATFPEELVKPLILASTKEEDWVIDPFCGTGTVLAVGAAYNRNGTGIDINEESVSIADERLDGVQTRLF